jgi:hypothetical protein
MTGAPIVPVGLVGTDRIQPIGARVPRPYRRAEIRFGHPLDPAAYGGSSRRRRQQMTADLMESVRRLSGRPTSDDFAGNEPPLVRGGTESVYEIRRMSARATSWRQAARFAVERSCGRLDDARVGEVRSLRCELEDDDTVRFVTDMSISVKFATDRPPPVAADSAILSEPAPRIDVTVETDTRPTGETVIEPRIEPEIEPELEPKIGQGATSG